MMRRYTRCMLYDSMAHYQRTPCIHPYRR